MSTAKLYKGNTKQRKMKQRKEVRARAPAPHLYQAWPHICKSGAVCKD